MINDKILLTGGTGFFGKALLRHWCLNEDNGLVTPRVYVLSRSPKEFIENYPEFKSRKWLTLHLGNILEQKTLPIDEFTHILHAATDSTLGLKLNPLERYIQIVDGTRNMLEFAVAKRIPRFLLVSSGGVYGAQPLGMKRIPETFHGIPDPLNSENVYSMAKRITEHLCAIFNAQYGVETIIARCFTFIGRDLPLNAHFAAGNFIRDALYTSEIIVEGDGTAVRSYMDQRDLAEWLIKILMCGIKGKAYNVGSDESISIRELAFLIRDTIAQSKPVKIIGVEKIQNYKNIYVPSIIKAKNDLGLKINYSLEESIKETIAHIK